MRIQHNIPSMNAYRNFTNNSKSINKNLEKLSSGYKINRAGDDAAGLAISEKMRAQITGLETAQKNAKDGISLIQTAEGALTEVHDMLNRMYKLAEQSANGTYDAGVDRQQLQKEVDSLRTEIDRIADSTNFNGIALLGGDYSAAPEEEVATATAAADGTNVTAASFTAAEGADVSALKDVSISFTGSASAWSLDDVDGLALTLKNSDGEAVEDTDALTAGSYTATINDGTNDLGELTFTLGEAGADKTGKIDFTVTTEGASESADAATVELSSSSPTNALVKEAKVAFSDDATEDQQAAFQKAIDGKTLTTKINDSGEYELSGSITGLTVEFAETVTADKDAATINFKIDDAVVATATLTLDKDKGIAVAGGELTPAPVDTLKFTAASASSSNGVFDSNRAGLRLQVGDTSDSYNQMYVSIDDIHIGKLGAYEVKTDANGTQYKQLLEAGATDEKTGKIVQADEEGNALTIESIDISTAEGAAKAMDVIKQAINYVSDTRGGLGAMQNRLEHTINNLSVMQENIQDAESTIRDTDVAEEMMKYTKNNILVQSAQAMLAQANQLPQGVLQLLQ